MQRADIQSEVFSALANPVRRDILMRLRTGPQAVNELAQSFDCARSSVSEHLQILRRAKLVQEERRGREHYYHLDPRPLDAVETWLRAFERYWKQRLSSLEDLLNQEYGTDEK
jgi:DNA-binding transcriptional ArsR family regulator